MMFIFAFVGVWLACVVGWFVVTRAFKSADVDKMKSRLLEKPAKAEKKQKASSPAQLIQTEDQTTGRVAVRLLRKFLTYTSCVGVLLGGDEGLGKQRHGCGIGWGNGNGSTETLCSQTVIIPGSRAQAGSEMRGGQGVEITDSSGEE